MSTTKKSCNLSPFGMSHAMFLQFVLLRFISQDYNMLLCCLAKTFFKVSKIRPR